MIYNKICDGQLDAVLGLVGRLHLEETFNVAIKMAERFRHNELSDLIEETMQQRFPQEHDENDQSYEDGGDEFDVYTDDRVDKFSSSSQISPESHPKRPNHLDQRVHGVSKKPRFD